MSKTITINIPENEVVPEIIWGFSPEENFLMLKIGSECLREGRNVVVGLTQKEIHKKIKEDSKEEIKKLEMDLLVQREMSKQMEEKIGKIYEGQVEQLKKQLNSMSEQIRIYESGNKENILTEIDKAREKYEIVLKEKENQNKLTTEALEKVQESVIKLTNKERGNDLKAKEGETSFAEYSSTFKDFKGFEIIDKHTQGGQGDFHLHFEEFDILADAKFYTGKVPILQREKIKNDLIKNEHINFAWLVSLNTPIDKWDKSPIMYEWINTNQCIVYINNLSDFDEPQKILRIVWFTCKELFNLIKDENMDVSELTDLKNKQFKMIDKIRNTRKHIRELNTNMNQTRSIVQTMDEQLREIIELESSNIVNSNFSLFDDWWDNNIELKDDTFTTSTELWLRFKQDNKSLIKDMEITVEKFKQYIKSKVPGSNFVFKNKNANSAFDIKGIKLKTIENSLVEKTNLDENITVELIEDVVKPKKTKHQKVENKVIKSGSRWSDKEDAELKKRYKEELLDIIELSVAHNRTTTAILLRLNKIGLLEKLEDARGYNLLDDINKIKR
jgi:hypothetical protein